jgi:cytidylate kinase
MATQVVTISASFGAGGSLIGPAVADHLGIPFVDRAIPAAVAKDLAVPLDRALAHDQQLPSGIIRILSKMANSIVPYGTTPVGGLVETDEEDVFRAGTEKVIHSVSDTSGGVILGRAAAVVLSGHPSALHVRLHGPKPGRLVRATTNRGLTSDEASKLLEETDRARIAYVKHFYKRDPQDPRLYHLVIDTTALSDDVTIDLIGIAARARAGLD